MGDVYLDHAATTPPSPSARAAVGAALAETWGNPSSAHGLGVEAERVVTEARRRVAAAVGAAADDIVFTSGGTEANALAVLGAARARARRRPHVITTAIEHSSVARACGLLEEEGFRVTRLPPDEEGVVAAERFVEALTPETGLVAAIWVNNEVGSVLPVLEAARRVKAVDEEVLFHADGVQALGYVPVRVADSALDSASFSSHKIEGPKGAGALWVRADVALRSPWGGGSQERGLRPGTENVPGIAGFGAAASEARFDPERAAAVAELRDRLWRGIQAGVGDKLSLRRNGPVGDRAAPHILNVSFVGLKGEVLVHALTERGVYASTGSACSARRRTESATLTAMGLSPAEAEGALRFSLSGATTADDVDRAAKRIAEAVLELAPFARPPT